MTDQELDDFRRLVLAFEDVATWCEQIAGIAGTTIATLEQRRIPGPEELDAHAKRIAEMMRFLESNRTAVVRIRKRIGLAPSA